MRIEAGKEMDKKCVLDWLNKVYISPSVSYSQYTDDEIRILAHDALVLLKEQEAVEVVRCKDCKHRPKKPNWETYESGFDIEFPEGSKCPCQCSSDKYYSWYPEDNWFCGDGERKD